MAKTRIPFLFSLLLATASPSVSTAQTNDADRLKAELEALRLEFSNRIAELEARLKTVEAGASATAPPTPTPPAAEASAAFIPPPPIVAAPSTSSKVFNPDMAAIGDFIGAVGKSPGGGEPSLQLHEAEVSLQAAVDPFARADVFLTFGPDEVGVEEAFITFPTLPGGFLMKVGKMRDAFGKINGLHNHLLQFTERPLMTQNLLGGEGGPGRLGNLGGASFPEPPGVYRSNRRGLPRRIVDLQG